MYVQRDLEDQIREELEERSRLNNNTNQQVMSLTTSGVLADLKNGYTRFKKDDKGYGSIEEKYGLTVDEVKEVFKLDSLKARKTAVPKRKLEIIDDLAPVNRVRTQAEADAVNNLLATGVAFPNLLITAPGEVMTQPAEDALGALIGANAAQNVQAETKSEVSKESIFA